MTKKEFELEENITIDNFHLLSKACKKIIFEEHIDIIERLVATMMNEKRFKHSISVANTCKALALANHYDPKKAYIAGVLHDVTKFLNHDEQMQILKYYDPDKCDKAEPILHSYSAPYFIKNKFNYYDADVLNAIYHHTDGESNSKLAKILYIADKREPLRAIDDNLLDLAFIDLDKAFILLKEDVKEYIKKKHE